MEHNFLFKKCDLLHTRGFPHLLASESGKTAFCYAKEEGDNRHWTVSGLLILLQLFF